MLKFFLCGVTRVVVMVLVTLVMIGSASMAVAAEPKLDDDWHITLVPYLWLPSVNGKMRINVPEGASNDFNLSSSNYLDNLKFAALLTMELEKGNWSVLTDFMYVNFSESNRPVTFPALPNGGLFTSANTGFKSFLFEGGPAYALYRTPSARLDFLAGVRYLALDTDASLNFPPVNFTTRSFSYNKDLVDPIIAVKGRFELGKGWFVPYYFDGGGFGINNEWSWQAYGAIGYHFSQLFSMTLGYRHLQYDFDNDKLLKDFYLSGAMLGFVFRF